MSTVACSFTSTKSFNKVHIELVPKKRHKLRRTKINSSYPPSHSKASQYQSKTDERIEQQTITNPLKNEKKNISYTNYILNNKLLVTCISLISLPTIAAVIVPNVLLYLMLPTIFQIPMTNQTNITQLNTYGKHCGDESLYTQWRKYNTGSNTVYMVITTTNCSFNVVPVYYTSISGRSLHTDFSGHNSIYSISNISFTIYVRNLQGYSVEQMFNYSQTEKWNVSWIGVY